MKNKVLENIVLIIILLIIYTVFIFVLSYPTKFFIDDVVGGKKRYDKYS